MRKLIFLTILLLVAFTLNSESMFSSIGIGVYQQPLSVRDIGMGRTFITKKGEINLSIGNPAVTSSLLSTNFSTNLNLSKVTFNDDLGQSISHKSASFPYIAILFPVIQKVNFGIAYSQPITHEYETVLNYENDEYSHSLILSNSGSIKNFDFLISRNYRNFGFGLSFVIINGKIQTDFIKDFDNSDYVDTDQIDTKKYNGQTLKLGFNYDYKNLCLGGYYQLGVDIEEKTILQRNHIIDEEYLETVQETKDIKYPSMYGLGITYNFTENFLTSFDFVANSWQDFNSNYTVDSTKINFINNFNIHFGAQYYPKIFNNDYLDKIPFRVGGYLASFPYEFKSKKIEQMFLTCGFSLPLNTKSIRKKSGAYLDFAFEYGKNGNLDDLGYDENVFRFSIGLSGFELWRASK